MTSYKKGRRSRNSSVHLLRRKNRRREVLKELMEKLEDLLLNDDCFEPPSDAALVNVILNAGPSYQSS